MQCEAVASPSLEQADSDLAATVKETTWSDLDGSIVLCYAEAKAYPKTFT